MAGKENDPDDRVTNPFAFQMVSNLLSINLKEALHGLSGDGSVQIIFDNGSECDVWQITWEFKHNTGVQTCLTLSYLAVTKFPFQSPVYMKNISQCLLL